MLLIILSGAVTSVFALSCLIDSHISHKKRRGLKHPEFIILRR